jgi:hypothetical protein
VEISQVLQGVLSPKIFAGPMQTYLFFYQDFYGLLGDFVYNKEIFKLKATNQTDVESFFRREQFSALNGKFRTTLTNHCPEGIAQPKWRRQSEHDLGPMLYNF